ncbi:MAG TPA: cobalamin-dependent protein [Acidimicrobiales bacterium]|nr:cobalamin-dependent protein [Acidimicrobiales bacterium]
MSEPDHTLNDVAERLGVHYMTAYRYVRTGRLAARQRKSQWLVQEDELQRFEESNRRDAGPGTAPAPRSRRSPVDRLIARLVAGDEAGSWAIAEEAQVGGATATDVYLELFAPAMRTIGERWADGHLTVADEHRATVVMYRLVGRMGPQFRPRGPRTGSVIVGAPTGELHGLPVALAADLLRTEGFDVVDLGANVPADAFVACALATDGLVAVVISVTATRHRKSAEMLVRSLRASGLAVPIVVGGAVLSERDALAMGADRWVPDIDALVSSLQTG